MKQLVIKRAVDCQRCDLHECRTQVVFGEGNQERGIMAIGEAPGGREDKGGRPFIGRSGKKQSRWFRHIGLTRKNDYYITDLAKCRPPENRDPLPEEIKACQRWLRFEFKKIKPWLVIPIGAYASKVVLNNPKFSIMRGHGVLHPRMLYHLDYYTSDFVLVFPLLHPAFIMRNQNMEDSVLDRLEWLKKNVLSRAPGVV